MYYTEYCLQPNKRAGVMIPVSSLPNFYVREDAGYSSYYWFNKADAEQIQAQKSSKGLDRFSVYSKYLVLDIDREDRLDIATKDMRTYSDALIRMGLKHSVWVSGGKGYHIYIHIEPMEGLSVPYSQLQWVKSQGWLVDLTLYQTGRLLSNPGRKSIKTGVRKHKIEDHDGQLLYIPIIERPAIPVVSSGITSADLTRVALSRIERSIETEPSSRHTALWSLAGACCDAGMDITLTTELLRWTNQFWTNPKDDQGLVRAVEQAYAQSQMSPKQSSMKVVGLIATSVDSSGGPLGESTSDGLEEKPHSIVSGLLSQELRRMEPLPNVMASGTSALSAKS
jgi:hypothetical protein